MSIMQEHPESGVHYRQGCGRLLSIFPDLTTERGIVAEGLSHGI